MHRVASKTIKINHGRRDIADAVAVLNTIAGYMQ